MRFLDIDQLKIKNQKCKIETVTGAEAPVSFQIFNL